MKILENRVLKFGLFLIVIFFITYPLLAFLGDFPLKLWDESRLAINAIEMLESKEYLITTFEHSPDLWNTKPPLLIWIQVLFLKLNGINELSLRLPSAIAAIFTCIVLFVFSFKILKNKWIGIIACYILITTNSFVEYHGTRTGDYDALLILFLTSSSLIFYTYFQLLKPRIIILGFLLLALGVLTKSIEGLMLIPGIFMYSLISKNFKIVKSTYFYWDIFLFLTIIFGYYISREMASQGYLEAVIKNELTGRYFNTIEEHHFPFWHYLDQMLSNQYSFWIIFIPISFYIGLKSKDIKINNISKFNGCIVLSFFIIISCSQTKLTWYSLPLYPFLAIQNAIFFYWVINRISNKIESKIYRNAIIILLATYLILPYYKIICKVYKPSDDLSIPENELLSKLSRYNDHQLYGKKIKIVNNGYKPQFLFYQYKLAKNNINIEFVTLDNLNNKDTICVYNKEDVELLYSLYPHTKRLDTLLYEIF